MSVPEPLRYSPFRVYRRKSLYTGLYGTNYSGPTRPHGDTTESAGVPIHSRPSSSHKKYMPGFSGEYTPHPGPMEMPGKDYRPYDSPSITHIPRQSQPPSLEPVETNAPELGVRYEDSLMDEDLLESQTELVRGQFGESALMQWDNNEVTNQILRAHTQEETCEVDAELRAQLLEIQMAVEEVRAGPLTPPNTEPRDVGLTIPQDFFEQQEQMVESQFHEFEPPDFDCGAEMEALIEAHEALFDLPQPEASPLEQIITDQPVEELGPMVSQGPESLEQIIAEDEIQPEGAMLEEMPGAPDYDDSFMTPGSLEQQMDEAPEPTEAMEPYPSPFGPYGGMMPPEMYDEQMQQMMDPYMMSGMLDPYMMPGPFGPGPMLDPGPGGPP